MCSRVTVSIFLLKRKAGHGGSSGGAVLARTAAGVLRRSLLERRYLPPFDQTYLRWGVEIERLEFGSRTGSTWSPLGGAGRPASASPARGPRDVGFTACTWSQP